jgi:hypothetical protein
MPDRQRNQYIRSAIEERRIGDDKRTSMLFDKSYEGCLDFTLGAGL